MAAWPRGPGTGNRYLAALATVAIAAVGAVGCGGGSTLTASEFVDRVNEQGVAVHLGHELPSGSGADAIYEIELPPLPGEPVQAHGDEHGGGGGASGSLYVYDDPDAAEERLRACRASAGLFCFQASNVVAVLDEESSGIAARRLGVAIRRLND